MTTRNAFFALSAIALSTAIPAASQAATIVGVTWFSGVASVAGTTVLPAPAPWNDNVIGDSPNEFLVIQKDYTAIGPVDLVFDLIDDGGTTEYKIVEGVSNSTGIDWTGYHIELGFGVGAGFVKSTAGDGLDFDSPDYDSTVDFNPGGFFFPTYAQTEDDLIASGGIHPNTAYAGNYIFHIDVPDGISQFTLRQSPVANPVPLPAGVWLFLSALSALPILRKSILK